MAPSRSPSRSQSRSKSRPRSRSKSPRAQKAKPKSTRNRSRTDKNGSDSDSDNLDFDSGGPTADKKKKKCTSPEESEGYTVDNQEPIKSRGDPNTYSCMKLENGLQALLIQTAQRPAGGGGGGADVDSGMYSDSDGDEDEAPPILPRVYERDQPWSNAYARFGNLDPIGNKTKGKPGGPKKGKRAKLHCSVSLCVNAGWHDDPPEFQGLAHFCEHMVHLGSEDFPEEEAFVRTVSNLSGHGNAVTLWDKTNYHFQILEDAFGLAHVMQMFTAMMSAPLFRLDTIEREIEAVDNEFYMRRTNIMDRLYHLINCMGVKDTGHPLRTFPVGNKDSLLPSGGKKANSTPLQKLQAALKEFHRRNYYAGNMSLVVKSSMQMPDLQKMVGKIFSKLPESPDKIPRSIPTGQANPYNNKCFRRSLTLKPCRGEDRSALALIWSFPTGNSNTLKNYRTKPLSYILALIDHGPLRSFLVNRNLVTSLEVLPVQSRYGSLLMLMLETTKEGCDHLDEVLEATFSYLTLLRDEANDAKVYAGVQSFEQLNFHKPQDRMVGSASLALNIRHLANNLRLPAGAATTQDILYGQINLFEYDKKLIGSCLNELVPTRTLFCLITNEVNLKTKFAEDALYGTEYFIRDVEPDIINRLEDVEIYDEFELPKLPATMSELPASSLGTVKSADTESKVDEAGQPQPRILIDDPALKLVYLRSARMYTTIDADVELPININLERPRDKALATQLVSMLQSSFFTDQEFQIWQSVGPRIVMDVVPNLNRAGGSGGGQYLSLYFGISGRNFILAEVLTNIFGTFDSFEADLTEEQFEAANDSVSQQFNNACLDLTQLAMDLVTRLKYSDTHTTLLEAREHLRQARYAKFKQFVTRVFDAFGQLTMRVTGSMPEEEVVQIGDKLKEHRFMKCREMAEEELDEDDEDESENDKHAQAPLANFPLGEHCLRVRSLNSESLVSIVYNYYQLSRRSAQIDRIVKLIVDSIKSPLCNELRTVQQLGYEVFCKLHRHKNELGFSVWVVYHTDKFCPCTIDQRIDSFLQSYYGRLLETKELGIRFLRGSGINKSRDFIEAYFAKYFVLSHPKSAVRKISVQILARTGKVQDKCCQYKEGSSINVNPTCRVSTWTKQPLVVSEAGGGEPETIIPRLVVAESPEGAATSTSTEDEEYFITNLDEFYKTCDSDNEFF